jgi:hypothetical protein
MPFYKARWPSSCLCHDSSLPGGYLAREKLSIYFYVSFAHSECRGCTPRVLFLWGCPRVFLFLLPARRVPIIIISRPLALARAQIISSRLSVTTSMPNPILQYPANVPPVAALVAARICGVVLTEKPEKDWPSAASATLTFQDKAKLKGIPSILRYIARSSSNVNTLYGSDPVSSTMVRLKHDSGICTRCDQAAPSLILTKPWTDTTLLPILYLLEIPFHRDAG